jgi:hypothetical protein
MRVLAVGSMMALLAMPAYAEDNPLQKMDKQRREDAVQIERDYQKALKNTRSDAPTAKTDPWGSVRSTDTVPKKDGGGK